MNRVPHKILSRFFSGNLAGQKVVGQYTQSTQRKKLPTKNTVCGKTILQKQGRDKDFPDKQKLKLFIHP